VHPQAPRRRPPGRYDEPSLVTQRILAVVLGLLFAGLVGAAAWTLYARYAADDVPVQVRGFDVRGDSGVVVEFEVTPPSGGTVWCLVRARELGGQEVGREIVTIPPADDGGAVRVRHLLPTTREPVTGEVPRCLAEPPTDEPPVAVRPS